MLRFSKLPEPPFALVKDPQILYDARKEILHYEFISREAYRQGKQIAYKHYKREAEKIRNQILHTYGIIID